MPITIVVVPVDVSGTALPVESTVTVHRNGVIAAVAVCTARGTVTVKDLPSAHTYRIAVEAEGFESGGDLVMVSATVRVKCRLRARHCRPAMPEVESLPPDLVRVLATYEQPDATTAGRDLRTRDLATHALPTVCPASRPLPDRDPDIETRAAAAWQRLNPVQRGGLLNLYAKMRSIVLGHDRTIWSYVLRLDAVAQDRIHVDVEPCLAADVKARGDVFKSADDSLHDPGPDHRRAGSVKSKERKGNLQLSFAMPTNGAGPPRVDADVDEAAGLGHVGQVLRNWLTGGKTHPFDVHQILVASQDGESSGRAIGAYEPCYRLGRQGGPADYLLPPL